MHVRLCPRDNAAAIQPSGLRWSAQSYTTYAGSYLTQGSPEKAVCQQLVVDAYKFEACDTNLFDCRNSVHLANFTSDTLDLDSNLRALLNDLITVVGELWWCRITIKLDF